MYTFRRAQERWWNKPLVDLASGAVPAELAILELELRNGEEGVWMNSRSVTTGVCGLARNSQTIKAIRKPLATVAAEVLAEIYDATELTKGCPDLVIWNTNSRLLRLVEVKCPIWDRPTPEQEIFMEYAKSKGIDTKIAEWYFEDQITSGA